ncbi:MAG: hypothetical protein EBX41_05450 [Chitinophagia bacterium]|nr:hypothetical protein [Chitinophagia bacterium]
MTIQTLLIQVNNAKAIGLLRELEQLDLIKVLDNPTTPSPQLLKPSQKYRGILSKEEAESLRSHINKVRSEWDTI